MSFSKEIIEILDYIGEKFGIAIDWTDKNVMPYLQELAARYINWEIATSVVWIVLGSICLALCIPTYKKFIKDWNEHKEDCNNNWYLVWMCLLCILFCIGLPIVIFQIFDIVKCIYLPELQIYSYIKTLMPSN